MCAPKSSLRPLTAFEPQYEDHEFCRLPSRHASPPLQSAGTLVVCNLPLECTPLRIGGDNDYGIGITSKIYGKIGTVKWTVRLLNILGSSLSHHILHNLPLGRHLLEAGAKDGGWIAIFVAGQTRLPCPSSQHGPKIWSLKR